ncbi:nitric oxide synthase oxygenase, partial [Escherichia sp. SS-MK2]
TLLLEAYSWEYPNPRLLAKDIKQRLGTNFDVLPLVFSINGKAPTYKEIPREEVKEVPIEHPEYPISSLGVKWYGVPMISDMRLEIGGISYTA